MSECFATGYSPWSNSPRTIRPWRSYGAGPHTKDFGVGAGANKRIVLILPYSLLTELFARIPLEINCMPLSLLCVVLSNILQQIA